MISCDVSTLVAAPPPTPIPPGALGTIVVQTAQAAASQTAALLPPTLTPTLTPPPTKTPTETPTPSPTFIFILATVSKTPTEVPVSSSGGGGDFGCKLVDQSPADDASMSKNQSFTASWKVQNTGGTTWNANAVDFVYLSGTKMASVKAADLPKTVASGESVTLKLSMTAPSDSGNYKTVWTLRQGKTDFCKVNITIVVP